jgi:integrase
MAKEKDTRQPDGRPTIFLGYDGFYHCFYPAGLKPDGSVDRKHIRRKKSKQVAEAIDDLEKRLRTGRGVLNSVETVEQWVRHWLDHIVQGRVDYDKNTYNTWKDYEKVMRLHVIPYIGQWRMTGATRHRLEPDHVELMYAALKKKGLEKSYIKRIHTILSKCLTDAVRRGRAERNVCTLLDPPEGGKTKVKALPLAVAQAVLREALTDPLAARWALGIIAGPRQGEVLAMRWPQVELDPAAPDVPHVLLQQQVQRRTWRHGCKDPATCKDRKCKVTPCPPRYEHGCGQPIDPDAAKPAYPCGKRSGHFCSARQQVEGCSRHKRLAHCKPCPPMCTGHASLCEFRKGGGLVVQDLKTDESADKLVLGHAVTELVRAHRERQQQQAGVDRVQWDDKGWVFPGFDPAKPRDPRQDYEDWVKLLKRAKVPHHRLHAARHTTGSFLHATGSDLKMIQDVLRHSNPTMSAAYVDVAMEAKQDALNKVAAALMDGDLSVLLGAKSVATPVASQ